MRLVSSVFRFVFIFSSIYFFLVFVFSVIGFSFL